MVSSSSSSSWTLLLLVSAMARVVLSEDQYAQPSTTVEVSEVPSSVSTEIPSDLQIGCEGAEERKDEEKARKARSFYYRVETPSSLVSIWRPAYYRIQRPYYIPVYGVEGRIPIFFPPQAVYLNPGFPLDNPPIRTNSLRPNQGYLPPKVDGGTTTEKDMFDNRFGEDYPVWDTSPGRPSPPPPPPSAVVPTRRPKPARTTTVPSLIHRETSSSASAGDELGSRTDLEPQGTQGTTPRPSQCVWAIINCCSAGSKTVSNSCFERFACPGPFWDRSPCESDFARVAIQTALDYYGNK